MVWFICLYPCPKEDLRTKGNAYLQQYFKQMKKYAGKEKNGQIRLEFWVAAGSQAPLYTWCQEAPQGDPGGKQRPE